MAVEATDFDGAKKLHGGRHSLAMTTPDVSQHHWRGKEEEEGDATATAALLLLAPQQLWWWWWW